MSFMGLVLHLKSSIKHSMYQQVKILQNSCFPTFGSSACHGNLSWHVQLFHPRKPQIIQELTSGLKSHKVKIQIRNKFKQNCYKYNLYKYFRLDSISSEFFSIWIIQTGSEFSWKIASHKLNLNKFGKISPKLEPNLNLSNLSLEPVTKLTIFS